MLWIVVALFAYFLFAAVFFVDKYLLTGPIASPKLYTFYTGVLRVAVVLLIPFIDFSFPGFSQLILSFLAGGFFVWGLFWFFKGLQLFEPSRVVPAVGGTLPVFTFLIVFVVSSGEALPKLLHIFALAAMILGSVLISYERAKKVSLESLKPSLLAAFLFAVSFVCVKYVYLAQSFLQGFIWITLGGFFAVLFLLLSKEVRDNLFQGKEKLPKKTMAIFISNQAAGAGANILQNWAVALAPLAYVALVNALQGAQYVFLLVLAVLLSAKFPQILKEEVSRGVIYQKIVAVLLIGGGLVLLTL
ncbi:MAG: Uncharacterized protein G01um101430_278 [Parcubacteria group bacterium Gr01-1014_30]|nr:MAG: Uncharacterized protein G01um101430_278 [Parcubacteria group bacterium Gr01-1014_30]